MHSLIIASIAQSSDGLSLGEVLADIPRDGAAIFVYALLAVSLFLIIRGSRGGRGKSGGAA